ncbi:MAG: hypothetical protein ACFFD4_35450 [Candidatus Odinarchaeota archaeon]
MTALVVPNWLVKYELNSFIHFKGSYQKQVDYFTPELFQYYVQAGNYISDTPFGLYFRDKQLHIFAVRQPEFLAIANYPITLEKLEQANNWKGEGLDVFSLVDLYSSLSNYNYSCFKFKSLRGKAQGELTFNKEEDVKKKLVDGIPVDLFLYKCEKFEAHQLEKDLVQILYFPKYNIIDNKFGFKFQELTDSLLEEDWNLFRTPEKIKERFDQLDDTGFRDLTAGKWEKNEESPLFTLKRPAVYFPDDSTYDLSNSELPFKEIIKEKSPVVPDKKFCIIIDKTGELGDNEQQIHQFVNNLASFSISKVKIFTISSLESDLAIIKSTIEEEKFSAGFLVVNSFKAGYEYIYDIIKLNLHIPLKTVKVETILKENNTDTIKLLWLSLRFRLEQSIYHTIKNAEANIPIFAVASLPRQRGEFIYLTGCRIHENRIHYYCRLHYNREQEKNKPTTDDFEEIWNEISVEEDKNESILVVIGDKNLLPPILKLKRDKGFDLAVVRESASAILNDQAGVLELPHDGQYTKITADKYLLMTNGNPDIDFSGVPKPVMVEIAGSSKIDHVSILKAIYFKTFQHPASFGKTKLPFELHLATTYPSGPVLKELLEKRQTRKVPL